MTVIYRVDQGTIEWHQLRMGVPTASKFDKIITPGGKPSAQAEAYMNRLIAERLLNEPMEEEYVSKYMEEGKQNEPHAAKHFEFTTGLKLEPVGFITNDPGTLGCSPDRLIVGRNEAVEIKCPQPSTHVGNLRLKPTEVVGDNYWPQVQGQLFVGGFDAVHFYSWQHRCPPVHRVYEPDEEYQDKLAVILGAFVKKLAEETERVRAMGAFVAREWARAVPKEPSTLEYLQ